ncbi:hypothetical protein PPYR_01541 [Photinus pyralis]|uniref:Uncharacterized protein n=1 Tax=Photinus pyralis TaxID=7054 RepID=A0A5N4B4N1_PHOPY|nr:cytochrome c oxidase subunit 7A2, mitochondrial-like [Photinus pyralis]KAB0804571.1 hypothetical protein PPYR_01541 [Photinus pyralis]
MNSARKVLPLARICARQLAQDAKHGEVKEVPSKYFARLKEAQKRFQVDDGVPIFLKAGLRDRVLYRATAALTFVGMAMSAQVLYSLAIR